MALLLGDQQLCHLRAAGLEHLLHRCESINVVSLLLLLSLLADAVNTLTYRVISCDM